MNYYGQNFSCPSEVNICPELQKPVLDQRTSIFATPNVITVFTLILVLRHKRPDKQF